MSDTDVHEQIKDDIMSGVLEPGERLIVAALRQRYGVGTSPIREALSRLLAAGFLELEVNRGYTVNKTSAADLEDLIETRCLMEEAALRLSIKDGDEAWVEGIVLAHFRLARTPRKLTSGQLNPRWECYHNAFHESILAACGMHHLIIGCRQIRDFYTRYIRIAVRAGMSREADEQHVQIAQACYDRNEDRATELLKQHYRDTGLFICKTMEI